MILEGGHRSSHYPIGIVMKTNYQKALESIQFANDTPELEAAKYFIAQAQVYATLALVDATRERA